MCGHPGLVTARQLNTSGSDVAMTDKGARPQFNRQNLVKYEKALRTSSSGPTDGKYHITTTKKYVRRRGGEDHSISDCGVTLQFLDFFLKRVQATLQKNCTTYDVVQKIIRAETEQSKSRYTEMIPKEFVGAPVFYVVHTWSAPFYHVVRSVEQYIQENSSKLDVDPRNTFIWLDIFAVHQHEGEDQQDDLDNIRSVFFCTTRTLLVVDRKLSVLDRAWCLFELWQAARCGHTILTVVRPEALESLLHAASQISIFAAETSKPEDRTFILSWVETPTGAEELELTVVKALFDSAKAASGSFKSWSWTEDPLSKFVALDRNRSHMQMLRSGSISSKSGTDARRYTWASGSPVHAPTLPPLMTPTYRVPHSIKPMGPTAQRLQNQLDEYDCASSFTRKLQGLFKQASLHSPR